MTAYTEVGNAFSNAKTYADTATGQLDGFTEALTAAIYAPPSVELSWTTIDAPDIPVVDPPEPPAEIAYNAPTPLPLPLSEELAPINIDTFAISAPVVSLPVAPTVSYGTTPIVPTIGAVALPVAPVLATPDPYERDPLTNTILYNAETGEPIKKAVELSTPAVPAYLSITPVSFGGVNLHEDWLTKFDDIPALTMVSPTPYSYARGPEYASALLDTLKIKLVERMAGGSGLAPAVEQAIWDRARSRETTTAQANQDEIMRASEAFGFQLPAGVLAAQLREAQQGYYDKLSTLSRDVAIKQAELEQENLKQTITQGMELEGKLIDYSYKMEQLTYETAKAYADNAIQVYNAGVEGYKALLAGYQTYAMAYKTIIDAEMTKVEVYKAELIGEQTKAQVNNTLVQQYKAEIEANMAIVEIYKAQVGGASVLVQLEQTKISAAGEQIKAYIAQVNAEASKVEAYKALVQASVAGVDVYRAQVQAYSAKVGAQAEEARAQVSKFSALSQAKSAEWDGYKAQVGAESARIQALGIQEGAKVERFKAVAAQVTAQGTVNARMWEANLQQYAAGKSLMLSQAKINTDVIMQTNNARLDAAKAGAQTYAQLVSSAYGMIHASAGISASEGNSVSYSYSNDTAGAAPTITLL